MKFLIKMGENRINYPYYIKKVRRGLMLRLYCGLGEALENSATFQ